MGGHVVKKGPKILRRSLLLLHAPLSTMAAAPDVAAIGQRLHAIINRPAAPLNPTLEASAEEGGLRQERWTVHSEPGALGEVPVLCVQHSAAQGPLPVVVVIVLTHPHPHPHPYGSTAPPWRAWGAPRADR